MGAEEAPHEDGGTAPPHARFDQVAGNAVADHVADARLDVVHAHLTDHRHRPVREIPHRVRPLSVAGQVEADRGRQDGTRSREEVTNPTPDAPLAGHGDEEIDGGDGEAQQSALEQPDVRIAKGGRHGTLTVAIVGVVPRSCPSRRSRPGGRPAAGRGRASEMASICTTSSAAFSAPSTATVATGMPLGICTVEYSASTPFSGAARERHADHGEGGLCGHRPGQVGGHARPADERAVAVLARGGGQLGDLGGRAMRAVHPHVGLDPEALQGVSGGLHLVLVVGRAHQDGDLVRHVSTSLAMSVRMVDPRPLEVADGCVGPLAGGGEVGARPTTSSTRPPAVIRLASVVGGDASAEHRGAVDPPRGLQTVDPVAPPNGGGVALGRRHHQHSRASRP